MKHYVGIFKNGSGRVFRTSKKITRKTFPFYVTIVGPFNTKTYADLYFKQSTVIKKKTKKTRIEDNPHKKDTEKKLKDIVIKIKKLIRKYKYTDSQEEFIKLASRIRKLHTEYERVSLAGKGKLLDNPGSGCVEIYSDIIAIEAIKGNHGVFPKEKFRHTFKRGAKVIGMPDGSIRIISKKNTKLWKNFDY